jgi:hypothetical protein
VPGPNRKTNNAASLCTIGVTKSHHRPIGPVTKAQGSEREKMRRFAPFMLEDQAGQRCQHPGQLGACDPITAPAPAPACRPSRATICRARNRPNRQGMRHLRADRSMGGAFRGGGGRLERTAIEAGGGRLLDFQKKMVRCVFSVLRLCLSVPRGHSFDLSDRSNLTSL